MRNWRWDQWNDETDFQRLIEHSEWCVVAVEAARTNNCDKQKNQNKKGNKTKTKNKKTIFVAIFLGMVLRIGSCRLLNHSYAFQRRFYARRIPSLTPQEVRRMFFSICFSVCLHTLLTVFIIFYYFYYVFDCLLLFIHFLHILMLLFFSGDKHSTVQRIYQRVFRIRFYKKLWFESAGIQRSHRRYPIWSTMFTNKW